MSSNTDVLEAVASIESPQFVGRTLGDLGLVKSVEKKVSGKIKVDLLMPSQAPMDRLNERLQDALRPYGRGADVNVELMTETAATSWIEALKEKIGAGIGEPGSRARVVAISSGKGGVGKSSVS
ncbi:MAG: hypothetical protein WCA93_12205, partial [Acidimicrobiia bacterium]